MKISPAKGMIRSWVEVSLSRLAENVCAIRSRIPSSAQIIAVVKANAYGHGVKAISRRLYESGIREFCVITLDEAKELREVISDGNILVLGGCLGGEEKEFGTHQLTAAVFDQKRPPADIQVEVKIDTGLTRLGIDWKDAATFIRRLKNPVVGLYSHFAASAHDPEFTQTQLERFLSVSKQFSYRRHMSDSGGLQYPEAHLDAVRPGLALYGISPAPKIDYLRPILTWKARILSVREVAKGLSIGYSRTYTTGRNSRIGVLPVGYADGYSRLFSNRGQVRVRGQLAPVVGRVSMDLTTIDLTDVAGVEAGEEAVILENENSSPLSAVALANTIGTIPYEILTSIGRRVARVYV